MKKINLRDYYPYYTQDMIVEVPDEVADILREYKLAEAAYFLRTYRHKAYFSLDYCHVHDREEAGHGIVDVVELLAHAVDGLCGLEINRIVHRRSLV